MIEVCLTSLRGEGRFSRMREEQQRVDHSKVRTDRQDSEWGIDWDKGGVVEGGDVITLSLVHCCLLSDLIWLRRHTWAKAHSSQVLQSPSLLALFSPSILPSLSLSVLLPPFLWLSSISRLSQSAPPVFSDVSLHLTLFDSALSLSLFPCLLYNILLGFSGILWLELWFYVQQYLRKKHY